VFDVSEFWTSDELQPAVATNKGTAVETVLLYPDGVRPRAAVATKETNRHLRFEVMTST